METTATPHRGLYSAGHDVFRLLTGGVKISPLLSSSPFLLPPFLIPPLLSSFLLSSPPPLLSSLLLCQSIYHSVSVCDRLALISPSPFNDPALHGDTHP